MGGKRKVLLVDGDASGSSALAARLSKCYEVVATRDPRETVALARKEQPHVILSGGTDVEAVLSAQPDVAQIPVVQITSRSAHLSEIVQAIDQATGR